MVVIGIGIGVCILFWVILVEPFVMISQSLIFLATWSISALPPPVYPVSARFAMAADVASEPL